MLSLLGVKKIGENTKKLSLERKDPQEKTLLCKLVCYMLRQK